MLQINLCTKFDWDVLDLPPKTALIALFPSLVTMYKDKTPVNFIWMSLSTMRNILFDGNGGQTWKVLPWVKH